MKTDINQAAAALGRKGGQATSEAKAKAVRANGAKGGRPTKSDSLRAIREYVASRSGTLSVRITRGGNVERRTDAKRGDGGKSPWWQFVGTVDEVREEMMRR